ncbi:MAG: cytochrome c [Pedobacter sp.]|nr:MAG: cytochrome c [Pedobacter sp.]
MNTNKIIGILFLFFISAFIYSCQNAGEREYAQYYTAGKSIYEARCQNCHGVKGEGLADLAPPLTDTIYMQKNRNRFACSIQHGTSKPMEIHGKMYSEKMPSFPDLAPIDIAKVTVYITNSFGNKQGFYSYDQVIKDLENCAILH